MKSFQILWLPLASCVALMVACKKDAATEPSAQASIESTDLTSSNNKSTHNIALLMRAVSGEEPGFENPAELNDLLMLNLPLNDAVLNRLIANKQMPDDLIELFVVLSAPVQKGVLQQLKQLRPALDHATIAEAQQYSIHGKQFRVINSNPIQIVVATELEHTKPYEDCGICNSVLYGSDDMRLITLKSPSDILHPIFKKCDSSVNECGQAMAVERKTGGRKSRPYYELMCDRNVDVVCINGKASQ